MIAPFRRAGPVSALLVLGAAAPAASQQTPPVLEVSGRAEVVVPADRARLSLAVETEADTAARAARENARRMSAVIAALRAAGGEEIRIETYGYDLRPRYRRPAGEAGEPPRIAGYRVTNHVRVVTDDLEGLGALLDAAVAAGANRVDRLEFTASDTRTARLQALREAVSRAREEARTIAEAMEVRLGPPLEVRGSATAPAPLPRVLRAAVFERTEPPTPVEPGTRTVQATVTIRYRILESGS